MTHPKTIKPYQIPFTFQNIQSHSERTFDLWTIKNPPIQVQLKRSLIFTSSLLITIFWPIQNLIINALLLALIWIMLSLREKPVYRLFLMTNLMLNISFLYYLMQIWLPPI